MPTQGAAEPVDRVLYARGIHRNLRAGCVNCKQRRAKYDETTPHCLRRGGCYVDCVYQDSKDLARPTKYVASFVGEICWVESTFDVRWIRCLRLYRFCWWWRSWMSCYVQLVRQRFFRTCLQQTIMPRRRYVRFHQPRIVSSHTNMCAMMRKMTQLAFEVSCLPSTDRWLNVHSTKLNALAHAYYNRRSNISSPKFLSK
jgi:hypothetical protein